MLPDLLKNLITEFKIDWFVLTPKYCDPYKRMFKSFSSGYIAWNQATVYISSRRFFPIVQWNLQHKKK